MFPAQTAVDPDREAVARALEGDTRAFDELILKYGDKLYGLIYHMTSHREDTRDLIQETFSRAYQSLGKFRGKSAFYTWLYQIAVNLTLNFLKKRKRRGSVSLNDSETERSLEPALVDQTASANPERSSEIHELQIRLNEALGKLSEAHRMVVTLFDIQGLSHKQIAEILSVSEGTVRSRLHYAHLQLQSDLQSTWENRA